MDKSKKLYSCKKLVYKVLILYFGIHNFRILGQELDSIPIYIHQMDSLKTNAPNQALLIAQNIKAQVLVHNDTDLQGLFFNLQGVCYKNKGKYNEAISSYKEALIYFEKNDNIVSMAGVYNNLGYAYRVQGEYKNALNYFLKGLDIFKKERNTKFIITILNNIGSLYFVQKKYDKAKEFFLEAIDSSQIINDFIAIAFAYNNLGEIELRVGNYQQAKILFLKSKKLKENSKDKRSKANTFANLFSTYFHLNNSDSSNFYYQHAKDLYLDIKDSLGLQKLELQKTNFNIVNQDINKGKSDIQKLEKLISELKGKNIGPVLLQTYHNLSVAYANEKNYEKAYFNFIEFFKLHDSLNNLKTSHYVDQLEAQFNNNHKTERIKLLEQQNQIEILEKEKVKNANFWLAIIVGFTILILLLTFNLIYNKQKTQKILEQKNLVIEKSLQEKELLLKEIHHRVKNNLQIISSLLNLQGKQENISAEELLKQSKDRIYAMSVIHEKLYQTQDFHSIDLKDYLENLKEYFIETYGLDSKQIHIDLQSDTIPIDIDKIVPCGLIINEIISNAIKYAFDSLENQKVISIQAHQKENFCILTIGDNGKGLPTDFQPEKKQTLGFRLIHGLVKQIKGNLQIFNQQGKKFNIQFPL